MTLITFKPKTEDPIVSTFTSLLDELLEAREMPESQSFDFMPRVNIIENDKDWEIMFELPGYNKKDIEINVEEGVLTVTGERSVEDDEHLKYYVRQIKSGKFSRSFNLPENASEDKINATFKDGILTLKITKEVPKPVKKQIKIS